MKQIKLCVLLIIFSAGQAFAQQHIFKTQGIPRPDLNRNQPKSPMKATKAVDDRFDYSTISFDSIKFWAGEGQNRAALVVDWYYEDSPTLVWGFRWDGTNLRIRH